jgi:hypothetical protein
VQWDRAGTGAFPATTEYFAISKMRRKKPAKLLAEEQPSGCFQDA